MQYGEGFRGQGQSLLPMPQAGVIRVQAEAVEAPLRGGGHSVSSRVPALLITVRKFTIFKKFFTEFYV
jgi:hypothetical protein